MMVALGIIDWRMCDKMTALNRIPVTLFLVMGGCGPDRPRVIATGCDVGGVASVDSQVKEGHMFFAL